VSHDREFLDRVCTKIVDTVSGVTFSYDGNYSRFLKLKKARMDAWKKVWWSVGLSNDDSTSSGVVP